MQRHQNQLDGGSCLWKRYSVHPVVPACSVARYSGSGWVGRTRVISTTTGNAVPCCTQGLTHGSDTGFTNVEIGGNAGLTKHSSNNRHKPNNTDNKTQEVQRKNRSPTTSVAVNTPC